MLPPKGPRMTNHRSCTAARQRRSPAGASAVSSAKLMPSAVVPQRRPLLEARDGGEVERGDDVEQHAGAEEAPQRLRLGSGETTPLADQRAVAVAALRLHLGVGARRVGLELEEEHRAVLEQALVGLAHP